MRLPMVELQESEGRHRLLTESSPVGIWRSSVEGTMQYANPALASILEYDSATELLETNVEAFHKETAQRAEWTRTVQEEGHVSAFEISAVTKRGNDRDLLLSGALRGDEIIGTVMDVTEHLRLQRQLLQADKLVSIGTLASGIAHEVNNPLGTAIGRSELLLRREWDPETRKHLQIIHDETLRASQVVRNLLSFSREDEAERYAISVNEVLEKSLELRSYELRTKNIEIRQELDGALPVVVADPKQLQQVFVNIIINAEQAMGESGGSGTLSVTSRVEGDCVQVRISDDGPGIPEDRLNRIFDPFFTTKPVGQGTGLGLNICDRIIKEQGGEIRAESKVGEGTTFVIELPVTEEG